MLKKQRSSQILKILINGHILGWLEKRAYGARLRFYYDQAWLNRKRAFAISRQLPLREQCFENEGVECFFENLLPDDKNIQHQIANQLKARSTHVFDLLEVLGKDCVGALQFLPNEGQTPRSRRPRRAMRLDQKAIARRLRSLPENPFGMSSDEAFRISLAGVHKKVGLLYDQKNWWLPEGSLPTTHILKPAIGELPNGPDLSLSVENEWLSLKICEAFGLPVPGISIQDFEEFRVLVVQRFDRQAVGKKMIRIPQEDLCQATGTRSIHKYENDGGPGIPEIMNVLQESDDPDHDRYQFFKTQLVFWLLGAIDGHAKNFSLIRKPTGFLLAPIYDVLSAEPHANPKNFPRQKLKFAMKVGNKPHYKLDLIQKRHWEQTADQVGFSSLNSVFDELVNKCDYALSQVQKQLPKNFPDQIAAPIIQGIRKRMRLLKG